MHIDIQPFAEYAVAPYVGAWIETRLRKQEVMLRMSHPTWVRGLKPEDATDEAPLGASHPTWVRGLKHYIVNITTERSKVAPYVGAWIETLSAPASE